MNSLHVRFAVNFSALLLGLGIGYLARKRGWRLIGWAPHLTNAAMICFNPPLSLLSVWGLQLSGTLVWLPVLCAAATLLPALLAAGVGRAFRLKSSDAGAVMLAGGVSNIGVTMGGTVCYVLFGVEGLGSSQLYMASWHACIFAILYPWARWYGSGGRESGWRLMLRNFTDLRVLGFYAMLAGLALNLGDVPVPQFVQRYHLVGIWMVPAIFVPSLVVGLSLRLGGLRDFARLYWPMSLIKFVFNPLLVGGGLYLLARSGVLIAEIPQRVAQVQAMMPVGVFPVLLAEILGLNRRLASALFLTSTLIFLVVVFPLLICLLGP